jgi:hypothetical protein
LNTKPIMEFFENLKDQLRACQTVDADVRQAGEQEIRALRD